MRAFVVSLAITVAACGQEPGSVTLPAGEWVCARLAPVTRTYILPAGRTAMPQSRTRTECVQWVRAESAR